MFNFGSLAPKYSFKQVFGLNIYEDPSGTKILYAGQDPADPSRALIRKIVKVSPTTFCYEETRITPQQERPSVHTQLYRIKDFDIDEHLTPEEIQIRGAFRPLPNVIGFSLFSKKLANGSHFSIVENALWKKAPGTWLEWFQDFRDRRDMSAYLKRRWA